MSIKTVLKSLAVFEIWYTLIKLITQFLNYYLNYETHFPKTLKNKWIFLFEKQITD